MRNIKQFLVGRDWWWNPQQQERKKKWSKMSYECCGCSLLTLDIYLWWHICRETKANSGETLCPYSKYWQLYKLGTYTVYAFPFLRKMLIRFRTITTRKFIKSCECDYYFRFSPKKRWKIGNVVNETLQFKIGCLPHLFNTKLI